MLAGAPISYRDDHGASAIRSGTDGTQTFYLKVMRRPHDLLLMDFIYPTAASDHYKPMIATFVSCFESSRPQR